MSWMATFLIVFREVIEIALTLVIVLAATQGIERRVRWIFAGFFAGILGSVLLAQFTQAISDSLQGMGQEIFNAGVLGISAILIGYTVVWMKRHSKELIANVKQTSREVLEGSKPVFALSLIIGLTVLRDGAEIVLLSHGLFASGGNTFALIGGAALGLICGSLVGLIAYFGLVKLNFAFVFNALSVMLAFLAAGMASHAMSYLSAVGVVEFLSTPLWDSSFLLSETSLTGQLFYHLVGYTSQPSGAQLLTYLTVLALIFLGLRAANSNLKSPGANSMTNASIVASS